MKRNIFILLILLSGLCGAQSAVDSLLVKMPAQNQQSRDSLSAALLHLGDAAILQVCAGLRPAGQEDAAQKYAVAGLCDYVGRSGGEADRARVTGTLLQALRAADDWQVQSFLIEQLALIGDDQAVEPLAALLLDEHLSDPASRAMIAINPKAAEKRLLAAFADADDMQKPALINALGEIGSDAAVSRLAPLAAAGNAALRDVALYALARSGSPLAETVLRRAADNSNGMEQQQGWSYYFDWIEQQSAAKAIGLYQQVIDEKHASHLTCRALGGLVQLQKDKALPALLAAARRDEIDILACALRLTQQLSGEEATRAWIEFAATATPDKRAMIVAAFGNHADKASVDFVTTSLSDSEQAVRVAAVAAVAKILGPAAFTQLFDQLKLGRTGEVHSIMQAMLTWASDNKLLDRLEAALPELPPVSQAAVVQAFADRNDVSKKETIFLLANSDSPLVRLAVFHAQAVMAEPDDLDRLLHEFATAQVDSEGPPLQQAIVKAANAADPVPADPVLKAFATSEAKRQAALLWVLARLNNADALRAVIRQTAATLPLRKEALQALASGPQTSAIPAFIKILSDEQGEPRRLAMQKAIRLTRDGRGLSPDERLVYAKDLMQVAKGTAEKQSILGIVGAMHTPAALEFVEPYLEFADTQQDAAKIAVQIAGPRDKNDAGLSGEKTIAILDKVLAIPGDEETLKKAKELLQRLGADRGFDAATGAELNTPPPGFVRLFNGRDLSGWKGLAGKGGNPYERAKLSPDDMQAEQARADSLMRAHWRVENGALVFDGHGSHLCTQKEYRNFEMLVDWKIGPGGDSGIYLRGAPQVQIWDTAQWPEGSGGLYNNKKGPSKPLVRADNPVGEWNTFRIKMVDDRVTVYLNDKLVVDNVALENYWDRSQPIFTKGQIELQSHGSTLYFRNVFMREIFTEEDGWTSLFDGETLNGWTGAVDGYTAQEGAIVSKPGSGGNLFTKKEYANFEFTFEFKLTPGANSGLGIRAPLHGDAAYKGMELQILDNSAIRYAHLKPYQYHGSIYGVVPAKRGLQKPVGEWNTEHVVVRGDSVRVELNGVTIVNADIKKARAGDTIDGRKHPGLKRKRGHIGFLGHDALVAFRNIYVKAAKK